MESLFIDPYLLFLIAGIVGFFMAFGIGANDVANAMGTSVGSKAITLKQAVTIAAIFEFLGAFLAGGEVTSTIRKGIVDPTIYSDDPNIFIIGMLASLLAAGTWLLIASSRGWPVSTTHTIVGAIVGFVIISKGISFVSWGTVSNIAGSWVTSPLISGLLAFIIFKTAQHFILNKSNPENAAIKGIPIYTFIVVVVISLVTARKGLKHVGITWTDNEIYLYTVIFSLLVSFGTFIYLKLNSVKIKTNGVESAFAVLMVVAACSMAFAHGSNDVANAIGPVSAIFSTVNNDGAIGASSAVNTGVLLLGAVGIVFGLAFLGRHVIRTGGEKITALTPSLGFSANLATSMTVVAASYIGFPISTTHTLVGGVIGVGIARSAKDLNLDSIKKIITSWLVTIPIGAAFTVLFFVILRLIFGV